MNLDILNEEQKIFQETVRKFVEQELRPHALDWEEEGQTPRWVWEKAGELGCLGVTYPEKWGGLNADPGFSYIFASELAKCGTLGTALGLCVQSDMATPALASSTRFSIREFVCQPSQVLWWIWVHP